jgi:hypothetical protein
LLTIEAKNKGFICLLAVWCGSRAFAVGAGRSAIPFRRTLGGEQGWRGERLSTPTAAEGGGRRPAFTKACLAATIGHRVGRADRTGMPDRLCAERTLKGCGREQTTTHSAQRRAFYFLVTDGLTWNTEVPGGKLIPYPNFVSAEYLGFPAEWEAYDAQH